MANLEEAVVSTLFNQSDDIADEILGHNPFSAALKERGKIKRASGGYEFRRPVMYYSTAVGGAYQDFDSFDLSSVNDADAFQFTVRQFYEPVAISGRQRRASRDEEALLDYVDMKIDAAIARLKNTIDVSITGDGTDYSGIGFEGVRLAVSSSPSSSTYGKIDRSSSANTWARNDTYSVSGGFTAANVQSELTAAMIEVQRGSDGVDFGFAGSTVWKLLHDSMTAIQRITKSGDKGMAGFRSLEFNGIDYVCDTGYNTATIGASVVRHLNTKYWDLTLVRDADFKPIEKELARPVDQDAYFTVILVEGALCCSAPVLQQYVA